MGFPAQPKHLKRYRDFAKLLYKYGRRELVSNIGLENFITISERPQTEASAKAEQLPADLEKLGPTYIKLGQLLSTRADMIPPQYLKSLSRLQDNVEPLAYETIEERVSAELGIKISSAFKSFEKKPLASASLSQVHMAELRDGRPVAVKVQRPGIQQIISDDLEAFGDVARFIESHTDLGKKYLPYRTLKEFKKILLRELNFENEARNLEKLRQNLKDFKDILVPEPIHDYTTDKLLTMEYIAGKKVTKLSPLGRMELDGKLLAEELFRAYLHQILINGFFHADPHPGNVFITEDGKVALIDLGMVAWIPGQLQKRLLQFLIEVSEGRGDEAAKHVLAASQKSEHFQEDKFYREVSDMVSQFRDLSMQDIEVGRVVMEITRISVENGILYPQELSILGKTLLNLDQVGRTLDPQFNPNESIRRNSIELFRKKMRTDVSFQGVLNSFIETKDLITQMPARLNTIISNLAKNELMVKVDAIDEHYLMTGLQKIANRLTLGLILAAMIIGAALIMDIESDFTLLGYPGIAILFFLIAGLAGLLLAIKILFHDEPNKRKG